jgi:3-hydroxyacyl-CoA dehydrogenase/enoyl-CoA hydratase/3-hydroxybutyryl-CoA epimerase
MADTDVKKKVKSRKKKAVKAKTSKKSSPLAPRASSLAVGDAPLANGNWRLERDADDIAWLTLDCRDSGTNTLSAAVLEELSEVLDGLAASPPAGLVIQSAKANGFIAGADVKEFTTLADSESAATLIKRGQSVMDRLEALGFPSVALIHGFCLGGGLELALACRYRVADNDAATRLGLPEVRLGIHPGFGGTVRLTRLIGPLPAMDLMLSGRAVSARAAKKLGMVDHAVPARHLRQAARSLIAESPPRRRPNALHRLAGHRLLRPAAAWYLRRQVAARAPARHYPAPYALIELWRRHADDPAQMLAAEAESVSKLITGYTARNLVRVFMLQERLKSLGKADAGNALPESPRVHVIGAGVMGGDIAAWCAAQGLPTTVQDTRPEALAKVMGRAHGLFQKKLKDPRAVQAAFDRLMPDPAGSGINRADIVIEAIFEDLDAKQELFRALEPQLKRGALLATNTSSIPLEDLAKALKAPRRLVGLHFFNPVAKMQLVEIVRGEATGESEAAQAAAFAKRIGRLPLPVRSSPGFLVNRALMPYLLEAVALEQEGVPPALIDKAAVDFGMPMGPIELADTVGLDICLSVANSLAQRLGSEVPPRLRALVDAGNLGRKSGRGFYAWNGDRPQKPRPPKGERAPASLSDRLMLRMLNEAVLCLREGVVADENLLDAGMIFGTGFAPFHGGPLHYARHTGPANLQARLAELAKQLGPRFEADAGWATLAGEGD